MAIIDSIPPDGRDADVAVVAEMVGEVVIEMTGDPQEHIGLVASGNQHLFKPFKTNVLLATVGDALHAHQRSNVGESAPQRDTAPSSAERKRTMPDFRCNLMDERGHMLFPAEIVADNLDAAIQHASAILQASNRSSSSRRVYSFEVWADMTRLFPPQSSTKPER